MKRLNQRLYTIQKIGRVDGELQYIENPDGYLWAQSTYATKIKAEDLPEWFIYGRYYKRWGYLSSKGVTDMVYVPNTWINHFIRDDCLLIAYGGKITKKPEEKSRWDTYEGVDERIWGSEILYFLRGARKHSGYDITELVAQIQAKADSMPIKHPHEFGDFQFDVAAFIDRDGSEKKPTEG